LQQQPQNNNKRPVAKSFKKETKSIPIHTIKEDELERQ
jgi:hypothetical protein